MSEPKQNKQTKNHNKNQLLKEALISTLLIVAVTLMLEPIPLKQEFTKGIRQFLGFDTYDLYYTGKHRENNTRDTNIVLVQIADDRQSIAEQIELVSSYEPKVIGLDALFEKPGDSLDAALINTINKTKNLVLASRVVDTAGIKLLPNFFNNYELDKRTGYINFLGHNEFVVVREFYPFLKVNGKEELSFSARITQLYNTEKFEKLRRRNNNDELINYKTNINNYTAFNQDELLEYHMTGQLDDKLKNKIVLIGYFVKAPIPSKGMQYSETPMIINDLHFTPMNDQMVGKSYPDMYGVVIHANIINMILSTDYATKPSKFVSYILAIIITFLMILYIINQYKKHGHPLHIRLMLLQLLFIIFILYLFLQLFNLFLIKVDLLPIMVAMVLSLEFFELYQRLAKWMHKKYNYKTIFTH